MPRATWKGFLRLSLVSCPISLIPAATKAKSIRLHQVRVPRSRSEAEPEFEDTGDERPLPRRADRRLEPMFRRPASSEPEEVSPATRIALRPVDRDSGETIEPDELVKGYEFERGQFVTFSPRELKALDIESSHTVDLTTFVPRAELDPIYFNAPYYIYPDGAVAADALRVIGAAMADAGLAGLGRIAMSRRERMAMVEPRGAGMVLITLRAADEVRAADFATAKADLDPEMVAIAEAIIKRRIGKFDPATLRDRHQEALRELVEAKLEGRKVATPPVVEQPAVIDLMAALKRSLAKDTPPKSRRKPAGDRRQPSLLLPRTGKGRAATEPTETAQRRRKKA
jgi:DNA end-binding protein Ku